MNAPGDWWRTFFSGMMVDFWLDCTTAEQTRVESDFIEQTLQVSPPARILDVPCGGGRHSLELAARGYRMTGVDISAGFLAAARSAPVVGLGQVLWEQREMRDLPWSEEFDGVFCFGNSFGYLDNDENAEFVQAVARVLKPGGRFVLDVGYISEVLLPSFQERSWYEVGDAIILSARRYDPVQGRLHVEYTYIRDGRSEKHAMSARLHSYREMVQMCEAAGLTDVQGFSSFTREPFQLGSRLLLLTAKKRA